MDESYANVLSDGYGIYPTSSSGTTPDAVAWQHPPTLQSLHLPYHLAQSQPFVVSPASPFGGPSHSSDSRQGSVLLTPPVHFRDNVQQMSLPPVNAPPRFGRGGHAVAPPCAPYLSPTSPLGGPSCPGQMDYGFPQAPSYLQSAQPMSAPLNSLTINPRSPHTARPKVEAGSPSAVTSPNAGADGAGKVRKPATKRTGSTSTGKSSRVPHSIVERRYRNNLRSQLDTLTSKVPVLKESYSCSLDIEDSSRAVKGPSKAVVISAAVKHIERLEAENLRTRDFVKSLQDQIEGLQRLVRCDECSILRYLQGLQMPTPLELGQDGVGRS